MSLADGSGLLAASIYRRPRRARVGMQAPCLMLQSMPQLVYIHSISSWNCETTKLLGIYSELRTILYYLSGNCAVSVVNRAIKTRWQTKCHIYVGGGRQRATTTKERTYRHTLVVLYAQKHDQQAARTRRKTRVITQQRRKTGRSECYRSHACARSCFHPHLEPFEQGEHRFAGG